MSCALILIMSLLEAWQSFYEGSCKENIWINDVIQWQFSDSKPNLSWVTVELKK